MIIKINEADIGGVVKSIASKSHAHRILICAALANKQSQIICTESSEDIAATAACLNALCARVSREDSGYIISPREISIEGVLPCKESGSTYRFLLPVACALGADSSFSLEGRLPNRPMGPLYDALQSHGIEISGKKTAMVSSKGRLQGGKYIVPGNVSSQFISGLLFALPLLDIDSEIEISGGIESKGYIDITLAAIESFGIKTHIAENHISIPGNQQYVTPGKIEVEGDWSNAAFWLAAAAINRSSLTCSGLKADSLQGDKAICDILERFGADVQWDASGVKVSGNDLNGITIDATNIPDLVPALAAVGAVANGQTRIINAARLKLKESNRLETIVKTLTQLGADIEETADGLFINGKKRLRGGKVNSCGDHRIAMMAAIASTVCDGSVIIEDAEAVNKSYPTFFDDFAALGGVWQREEK